MTFDLTNLSAGDIAVITILGSIIVAAIGGLSAYVIARVNANNAVRVEYLREVRLAKAKQARLIRRALNKRIKYLLALRSGNKPGAMPEALTEDSTFLPFFVTSDSCARPLIRLANQYRTTCLQMLRADPDAAQQSTKEEVHKLLHILIMLNFVIEAAVLRDTADPTQRSSWLVRETARYVRGEFPPYRPPTNP